jgi:hypothetical protein
MAKATKVQTTVVTLEMTLEEAIALNRFHIKFDRKKYIEKGMAEEEASRLFNIWTALFDSITV